MTTTPAEDDREPLRPLLRRIWRDYLSNHQTALYASMALAALAGGLTALLLKFLEPAIDILFTTAPQPERIWGILTIPPDRALIIIPLIIVILSMIRSFAMAGQAAVVNRLGHGVVGDIQKQLFSGMVRADLARLRSQHSGGFVSSVLFDANLVREAFTTGVVNYTQHGLTLIGVIIAMAFIDLPLTLIVLLGIPAVNGIIRRFGKKSRKAARGAMAETETLSSALMESLDGVRVIKIENREAAEEARVAAVIDRRQRHVIKGADSRAFAGPASDIVAYVIVAAVMAYAGWSASQGQMTVGAFAAFIALVMLAGQSLRQVTNLATVMSEGFAAARRLFRALDIQPEIREAASVERIRPGPATVALEGVDFSYGGSAVTLSNVSLQVAPGETVALVGPSGGGKSTVLSLLPRFYDVTGGRVTLNGRDVRDLSLADLRAHIALVTQEPFLFDDTIAANIAYGRDGASQDEVEQAARAAAAHDFIVALPQGYDTRVGEAGLRLSGGQRQRIAIARAFLKDAPILLLDEATSALDTESEALVQAALERLMDGRATLLIAHRLSTVRKADRIYVLDAGRVVEEGSHNALVARRGLYARLARQQSLDGERDDVASLA
ncbi:ABC transporter ATP-binding protein [Brevundimonas sp. S30B]|uniref:ABC transporter ATP-binding protein n=1 Tax=unclassified Brevundimonas TaxID=2622653 RepID=UPI00107207AD|nr:MULTISPECIES: ABC transporter ATP-binding protein [unclassified Brevundimonas]QBX38928.1 ABC transporter ATP-binding protein [Brevundimonas sp. MF30-B]TFW02865.1 ABC transporter ATP-binding protein [Brevundimonas sp. S30B]